ncbi:MAG: cell division protein [Betaproteobacteria bacterium]|nr:cell division protein [Betaproteobacteria bacterium]
MVQLQESLIGLGIVVVAGVIAYNKWQEWRAKKSVEQAFSTSQDDVLMAEGQSSAHRHEPVLSPLEGPDVVVGHAPAINGIGADHLDPLSEPARDQVPPSAHANETPHAGGSRAATSSTSTSTSTSAPAARRSPLDPAIDCIIPVLLEAPLRGERVMQAFQHLHLVGSKPVKVAGLSGEHHWEAVAVGGVYTQLQVGVQLATRSGALTELEFSELASRLDQMADDLGASPDLPDMGEVVAKARSLHQLLQEFDAQLSINVRSNAAPWPMATLKPALQRQGMELRPDGKLVMPDGEGGLLFSVNVNANPSDDSSAKITLLLPVALVPPDRGGFKAMTAFAKSLANRLSGTVVDDEGQPLPDASLTAIAEQVADFYRAMAQAGIPAGSPLAQRLFA